MEEKKRSLWGSVVSAFVEEVPEKTAEPEQKTTPTVAYNPAAPDTPSPNAVRPTTPPPVAELDPALMNDIRKCVLEKAPIGWAELEEQLTTLRAVIPDEATCYKAAIAVLSKKMSITQLESDAQTCMDLLDAELLKFNSEFDQQQNTKVGKRKQNIANLSSQIEDLQKRINDAIMLRDAETMNVDAAINTLKLAQDKFVIAHTNVKKEFAQKKEKLSTYGKTE